MEKEHLIGVVTLLRSGSPEVDPRGELMCKSVIQKTLPGGTGKEVGGKNMHGH